MLNNDFKELVYKLARYKKQKTRSRYLKILAVIMIAALAYYVSTLSSTQTTIKPVETNTTVPEIKVEENLSTKVEKPEVNKHSLQVTTEEDSLEQLTKNQEKSKSYSATISLANYHYSKKEYDDAVKWAIAASKLNKKKARPWLVYAQSKLAAGKVDIAKKALELYLKQHKSKEAQDLLDKLNSI